MGNLPLFSRPPGRRRRRRRSPVTMGDGQLLDNEPPSGAKGGGSPDPSADSHCSATKRTGALPRQRHLAARRPPLPATPSSGQEHSLGSAT